MAHTLTEVDNTLAWGPVMGPHPEFPWMLTCGEGPRARPHPGMLVTSYAGHIRLQLTGRLGLGIIIGVRKHDSPLGDIQYRCTVLWNFDVDAYANGRDDGRPPAWYVAQEKERDHG